MSILNTYNSLKSICLLERSCYNCKYFNSKNIYSYSYECNTCLANYRNRVSEFKSGTEIVQSVAQISKEMNEGTEDNKIWFYYPVMCVGTIDSKMIFATRLFHEGIEK